MTKCLQQPDMNYNSSCVVSILPRDTDTDTDTDRQTDRQTHTDTHTRPGINACYSAQMSKVCNLQVSCSGLRLLDGEASLSMCCCQMLLSLLPHTLHVPLHTAVYLLYMYTRLKPATQANKCKAGLSRALAIYGLKDTCHLAV